MNTYHGLAVREGRASDRQIVDEVYLRDEYAARQQDRTDALCVDLGASIGVFARLWHELNPTAPIVCVETAADAIPVLEANVGAFARIVHATASYLPYTPRAGTGQRSVTLEDVLALMEERYIGLLKIDIEGMEYDVLEHVKVDTLGRTRAVVGEYHGGAWGQKKLEGLCARRFPDHYLDFRPQRSLFTLFNPYFWWRRECGA